MVAIRKVYIVWNIFKCKRKMGEIKLEVRVNEKDLLVNGARIGLDEAFYDASDPYESGSVFHGFNMILGSTCREMLKVSQQ